MEGINIIKIGGRPLADIEARQLVCRELAVLAQDSPLALVHGGGSEVSRISSIFGLEATFVDGIRQTSIEEMEVVEMVLAGRMNTVLVRAIARTGLKAVGLSGCDAETLRAEAIADESRTGRVTGSDATLIQDLMRLGYLPVCSSVAMDGNGEALNINADEAALELAAALGARRLIYLSDVAGIRLHGATVKRLNRREAEVEIASGEIAGGMIPKVRASFAGLSRGIGEIIIGSCTHAGSLAALIDGAGSHLYLEQEEP